MVLGAWFGLIGTGFGQDAAVSAHFNFGENVVGDISVCEVRVPADGLAVPTYYETLGFWGNKGNSTGNGYAGIQKSDDRRGSDVHIFSIWHAIDDPKDTANFPYATYLSPGTTADHFGGEGVGLKTWNFKLKWDVDVWYSHVVRVWDVGAETHYAFFVRDGVRGEWLHFSTIAVREKGIRIKGANDAFIEDWKATGVKKREVNLRGVWRRDLKGAWHGAQSGVYSPNGGDLQEGKRSFNYRTNWDAGVAKDETGGFYYMRSGGAETKPTLPLAFPGKMRHEFSLKNDLEKPGYAAGSIESVKLGWEAGTLSVEWEVAKKGLPQFGYEVAVYDNKACEGEALSVLNGVSPEKRVVAFNLDEMKGEVLGVRVKMVDLFDGVTEKVVGKAP